MIQQTDGSVCAHVLNYTYNDFERVYIMIYIGVGGCPNDIL